MKTAPARFWRILLAALSFAAALGAHPMGNFSVNHYARLNIRNSRAEIAYVLDLAEIPAFELLNQWQIDWHDQPLLNTKSRAQAAIWVAKLKLTQSGRGLPLIIDTVSATATEGAAGMPTLRVSINAHAAIESGAISYDDENYPGRAGWKEVITPGAKDISHGLTTYPADPNIAPPDALTARLTPPPQRPVLTAIAPVPAAPITAQATAPASPSFSQQQPSAPGTVVRGDYLSQFLHRRDFPPQFIALGILAAIGLGAMHALSPGHGKTIVAAYLVGSRGTLRHAGLLGFVVTFTHTFTVFLLGIGVLFFQDYIVPEKIVPVLGVISGLSIVAVGATLLYRRSLALMHDATPHTHTHQYSRGETHTHDGTTHTHIPEGKLTPGSLIALGISGGLVPCPSALILMLSAIALGHPGLGLVLLIAFSSGLAAVLMGIGMLALYARNLLPNGAETARRPIFQLLPIFSAVIVVCLGLAMSAVSAGWIQPVRFLS